MNEQLPDFYIVSNESSVMDVPRKCYRIKRFRAKGRDDYLLIQIDPPLDCWRYGLNCGQITKLVLASHYKGVSLFPIKRWPVHVYVLRPLIENPEERDALSDDELELIDWAEIYDPESVTHY